MAGIGSYLLLFFLFSSVFSLYLVLCLTWIIEAFGLAKPITKEDTETPSNVTPSEEHTKLTTTPSKKTRLPTAKKSNLTKRHPRPVTDDDRKAAAAAAANDNKKNDDDDDDDDPRPSRAPPPPRRRRQKWWQREYDL